MQQSAAFEEDLQNLLSLLVQTNTVNPPGYTSKATKIIKDWAETQDLHVEIIPSEENVNNILVSLHPFTEIKESRLIVLSGHLDTVPAGPKEEWDFNPFAGDILADEVFMC